MAPEIANAHGLARAAQHRLEPIGRRCHCVEAEAVAREPDDGEATEGSEGRVSENLITIAENDHHRVEVLKDQLLQSEPSDCKRPTPRRSAPQDSALADPRPCARSPFDQVAL